MDFDYQMIKDVENRQREEAIRSLPRPHPRPVNRPMASHYPPKSQFPKVKSIQSINTSISLGKKVENFTRSPNSNGSEMEVLRVLQTLAPFGPGHLQPLSPSLRAQTLLWFQKSQLPRLRSPGHHLPVWLHGFATRREAEELLKDKEQGCFLLRLSESKIGFVLSYRGKDRCRHFIIEEDRAQGEQGHYLITGEDSRHGSLQELISYYTRYPVGPFPETLTIPCTEQASRGNEDVLGQSMGHPVGIRGSAIDGEVMPAAPSEAPPERPASPEPHTDITAQYAVVRKVQKNSPPWPESHLNRDAASRSLEVPSFMADPHQGALPETDSDVGGAGGGVCPNSAHYSQANKAPRACSNSPTNTSTYPGPQEVPSLCRRASADEHKYWEMVPMHTYEETDHLIQGQIDFYAMGWRQGATEHEMNCQQHVYSEVNLGREDDSAQITHLTKTSNLPLRPLLAAAGSSLLQRLDIHLSSTLPYHPRLLTPCSEPPPPADYNNIYEQIPERGQATLPLPPPNPKH